MPDALLLIPCPRQHRSDTAVPFLQLFCCSKANDQRAVGPRCGSRCAVPLERAAAVGSDPQAQRIELDKALGVGLIIGTAIVVKGGDIGVEQTV